MKRILLALALFAPVLLAAQVKVWFEGDDYRSLGVYDLWEASPFMTGELEGNYAVIVNHLKDSLNRSDRVLALQRSRYGSNTFGVKVDLKIPFELTPQTKYVSFMVHRPYSGRVMVVGLGKRRDRPWQDADTQQFVAISRTDVPPDRWCEVSLPVKGVGGIDVYSIVVVPDCESPHDYMEDKACYIDNIEVKM